MNAVYSVVPVLPLKKKKKKERVPSSFKSLPLLAQEMQRERGGFDAAEDEDESSATAATAVTASTSQTPVPTPSMPTLSSSDKIIINTEPHATPSAAETAVPAEVADAPSSNAADEESGYTVEEGEEQDEEEDLACLWAAYKARAQEPVIALSSAPRRASRSSSPKSSLSSEDFEPENEGKDASGSAVTVSPVAASPSSPGAPATADKSPSPKQSRKETVADVLKRALAKPSPAPAAATASSQQARQRSAPAPKKKTTWVVAAPAIVDEASYSSDDDTKTSQAELSWSASAENLSASAGDSWSRSSLNDDEESSWSAPVRGPKLNNGLKGSSSSAGSSGSGSTQTISATGASSSARSKDRHVATLSKLQALSETDELGNDDLTQIEDLSVQAIKRRLKRKQHVVEKLAQQGESSKRAVGTSSLRLAIVLFAVLTVIAGAVAVYSATVGAPAPGRTPAKSFALEPGRQIGAGSASTAASAAASGSSPANGLNNVYIVENPRGGDLCVRVPPESQGVAEHISDLSYEELTAFYDANGDSMVSVEEIAMALFPDSYKEATEDLVTAATQLLMFVQRGTKPGQPAAAGGIGPCKRGAEMFSSVKTRAAFSAEVAQVLGGSFISGLHDLAYTEDQFAEKLKESNPRSFETLTNSFGVYDLNGDGRITYNEFKQTIATLKIPMTDIEVRETFLKTDVNADDYASFSEFAVTQSGA